MLISRKHRALILRVRDPDRITTVIPKAKKFTHNGKEFVAVRHGVDEVKVLGNIGIPAPSPIKYYYDWPGRFKPFLAQRETADFLTLNNRAFVLNDLGCVDSETEFLSPTGWVKISDYSGGEVAQYLPESKRVEFVAPIEYVKKPCEWMFHLKTKYGLDQMLSPEHRVLLESKASGGTEVVQAEALYRRQMQWVATGKNDKAIGRIGWSKAAIPVIYGAPGGQGLALSDAALRVQIAVIADGHFSNSTHRCVVRLKKERKVARLRDLLRDAGITYTERKQDTATAQGFTVFAFQAPMRVKEFDARFWASTNAQLAIVRDEVIHWDGCFRGGKTTREFISNSKASADFVQYAFNAGGFTARIVTDARGPTYSVLIRDNGTPLQVASTSSDTRNPVMHKVPSTDGFKYCFMVPSTFLLFRRNGCVFASGNTGKTLGTLWAYDYLRSIGVVKKALVVTPLSTLERTWADEVFTHFPHLETAVLFGSREKRLKMLAQDADLYLINHDGLKVSGIMEALKDRPDIDLVIVDEIAQVARTAGTDRYKVLHQVINRQCARRTWGLTGTPIPSAPTDAWAQCRLLVPERVPPYFSRFKDTVMRQISNFIWVPRPDALKIVHEAMQPAIRYSRDECVDLPPCIYEMRQVSMTDTQKKAYKDMLTKLKTEIDGGEVTAVNEAVKAQKLIQIACGIAYGEDRLGLDVDAGPRLEVVSEVCEEAGTKVIVFVPFVAVVELVSNHLRSKGFTVECIHGGVSKSERDRIFHAFQKTDTPKVLVAQPAAMSHGLTLTAASTIVWYAPITSNETFTQANGRITRPGQQQTQFIIMLEGTDLERRYFKRLKDRENTQGTLLGMVQDSRVTV